MPKRGQKQPYKVDFQYPEGKKHRIAHGDAFTALKEARDIARRGAAVRVFDGDELIADYVENPVPDDNDDIL